MPIAELLNNARFLTNQQGEQTDVLLSIETWQTLLSLVEQLEQDDPDQGLSLRPELEQQLAIGNPPVNEALLPPMLLHAME
jgi:hypothetical protein